MRIINVVLILLVCMLFCAGCESSDPLYKEYDGYDYSKLSKEEVKEIYKSIPDPSVQDYEFIKIDDNEFNVLEEFCDDYINNRYNINSTNVYEKYKRLKDIFEDNAYSGFYNDTNGFVESVKNENVTIIVPEATFIPGNYIINYKYNSFDCLAIYYEIKITTDANGDFFIINNNIHYGDTIICGWLYVVKNEEGLYKIIGFTEDYGG